MLREEIGEMKWEECRGSFGTVASEEEVFIGNLDRRWAEVL